MKNRIAEQNDPNELVELTGDSTQQVLSPVEEYRKATRKRRGKALLFSLLVFLDTSEHQSIFLHKSETHFKKSLNSFTQSGVVHTCDVV